MKVCQCYKSEAFNNGILPTHYRIQPLVHLLLVSQIGTIKLSGLLAVLVRVSQVCL